MKNDLRRRALYLAIMEYLADLEWSRVLDNTGHTSSLFVETFRALKGTVHTTSISSQF